MSTNTTSWEYTYDSSPTTNNSSSNGADNNNSNDGGIIINCVDEETTTISFSSHQSSTTTWWQEPIVVGYAFGAKKMSTMGVVMAEASRAEVIHEEQEEDFLLFDQQQHEHDHEQEQPQEDHHEEEDHDESLLHSSSSCDLHIQHSSEDACMLTSENLEGLDNGNNNERGEDGKHTRKSQTHQQQENSSSSFPPNQLQQQQQHQQQQRPHTIISMASDMGDIKHIVRYFRSNCSSAAGSMTETTVSTPTVRSSNTKQSPVRISFVPLDTNIPLEEQHGGKFDLILHKLTEDILSIAMDDKLNQNLKQQKQQQHRSHSTIHTHTHITSHTQNNIDDSRSRVQTLLDYKKCNECCCLVDDPNHVQTLMNRSDISKTLEKCLQNVSSASGHPVRTPKFVVVDDDDDSDDDSSANDDDDSSSSRNQRLKQQLEEAKLHVPLIVKPLIAAGTKQSHYMTIILQESALLESPVEQPPNDNKSSRSRSKIPPKSLIQQYENHNATLYKVYVMGENVHVYQRPSLPDLPTTTTSSIDLLEFDSQRPYPRLQDFGFTTTTYTDNNTLPKERTDQEESSSLLSPPPLVGIPVDADAAKTTPPTTSSPCPSCTTGNNNSNNNIEVTPDEVRPIVEALKEAFGLELFGFDILISSSSTTKSSQQQEQQQQHKQQWLVVDVNYFPSYKEVPNFPALLAQYLTNRVLHQRRRTLMLQQRRQEEDDYEEKGEYVGHPR